VSGAGTVSRRPYIAPDVETNLSPSRSGSPLPRRGGRNDHRDAAEEHGRRRGEAGGSRSWTVLRAPASGLSAYAGSAALERRRCASVRLLAAEGGTGRSDGSGPLRVAWAPSRGGLRESPSWSCSSRGKPARGRRWISHSGANVRHHDRANTVGDVCAARRMDRRHTEKTADVRGLLIDQCRYCD